MKGFFPSLGDFVARFRWAVLALWIVFVGASFVGLRGIGDKLISGGLIVKGSESQRGMEILETEFNRQPTRSAIAVFTSEPLTLDSPESPFCEAINRELNEIRAIPGVEQVTSYCDTGLNRLVTADRHTTYAVINFAVDEEEARDLVPLVREAMDRARSDQVQSYLTGYVSTAYDLAEGSKHDLETAHLYSLPFTVFLLVTVFGSLIAAGLPTLLGAAAVAIALAAIGVVAQRMETSIFALNTASMIGLGLGIDFSLLMVSRYREELARGLTPHMATVRTVATAGQSIVFSGLTVMLGIAMVLMYELVIVRSIALGMLMVVAVAMVAAVTLLPALLCLLGRRVNSLTIIPGRKQKLQQGFRPGRWHAWSMLVMKRPWIFLAISMAILIGLALPAKDLDAIGTGSAQGISPEAGARQGFEKLTQPEPAGLPIGEVFPISVVVRTDRAGGAFDPAIKDGIWKLTERLAEDDRVARVESLANINPNLTQEQFRGLTAERLTADPAQRRLVGQTLNIDGAQDTYLLTVISRYRDNDARTTELLRDIRGTIIPAIRELRGSETMVTGSPALTLDFRDKLYGQFTVLIFLVLAVTYVVMVLFFHSLLLPLKAVLMNVVSILAAYGLLVMVFQWGWFDGLFGFESPGRLTMFPPVLLFSVLFGLSTDYEVFLLSRVKEIYKRTGDNERSVAEGLERTAGTITAAGAIMVVVFGSYALGHVLVIKELGIGQAAAVLLDSTIIRVMLVPASMCLMGRLNWWMPKWLDWIPEISEGADEDDHPAAARSRPVDGQMVRCPSCGISLPARARFCGRCGQTLGGPGPAVPRDIPVAVGMSETLVDRGYGLRQPGPAVPNRSLGADLPANQGGLRRIPITLRFRNAQRPAWLILRDCQVEKDPSMPSVPVVAIDGVDLMPLPGEDPPEIQVRNARIRL